MGTDKITLLDYANARDNVVLFYASFGKPTGEYEVMGHREMDFADERGVDLLTGTIDADGMWSWDGEGEPTDNQRSTITKLQAYVDAKRWSAIVKDYDDAGDN